MVERVDDVNYSCPYIDMAESSSVRVVVSKNAEVGGSRTNAENESRGTSPQQRTNAAKSD